MKVEQEKFGFEPIHITIYSKEEADIMWAALNAPAADILRNSQGHLNADNASDLAYRMYCAFDDIHHLGN